MSMPITAIAVWCGRWHGVLLVWAPLASLSLAGQEHGRTIPYRTSLPLWTHFAPGIITRGSACKIGRIEEAKPAVARVLNCTLHFAPAGNFSGVDCAPALAASLSDALGAVGLPG